MDTEWAILSGWGSIQTHTWVLEAAAVILQLITDDTNHEQIELFPKHHFRCDCPTSAASPLRAEPSARVDTSIQALRLIAHLGCPFNALLLGQQSNGQYKRVAAEHEIIITGVPSQTNPKDIRAKVLEIV